MLQPDWRNLYDHVRRTLGSLRSQATENMSADSPDMRSADDVDAVLAQIESAVQGVACAIRDYDPRTHDAASYNALWQQLFAAIRDGNAAIPALRARISRSPEQPASSSPSTTPERSERQQESPPETRTDLPDAQGIERALNAFQSRGRDSGRAWERIPGMNPSWQFMRLNGRLYLHVNREYYRLDPAGMRWTAVNFASEWSSAHNMQRFTNAGTREERRFGEYGTDAAERAERVDAAFVEEVHQKVIAVAPNLERYLGSTRLWDSLAELTTIRGMTRERWLLQVDKMLYESASFRIVRRSSLEQIRYPSDWGSRSFLGKLTFFWENSVDRWESLNDQEKERLWYLQGFSARDGFNFGALREYLEWRRSAV